MNAVERVKAICKERKIPISRLEMDLGFGNAYVSGLKRGMFPADRLKLIAEYLNVSDDYLATGKEPALDKYSDEVTHLAAKIRNDTELSKALLKYFELPDIKKKHIIELINFLGEGV